MAINIDPDSFVTRHDLFLDFGIGSVEIDAAIVAGELTPARGGNRFLGAQVLEFLKVKSNARGVSAVAASLNAPPQPQSPPRATSAAGMIERNKSMTTEESKGIVKLFNEEVAATMAHGCDRGRAVEIVATRNPALHKQYLVATQAGAAARRSVEEAY